MSKNTINYLTVIFAFFLGIWGTLMVIYYIPEEKEEITEEIVQEVNITESDSISSSIDKVYDSVVTVENYTNTLSALGTGFVYKTDDLYGYILTNNHVIEDATTIKVLNSEEVTTTATLLGHDEYADLAVLRVDKDFALKIATLGSSVDSSIGDTVFTVGTPVSLDYTGTVTKGIISAIERTVDVTLSGNKEYMMDVIQTNASINPGNSGGPLVNINGDVIGVNTLKLIDDEIEGMGFAIPIEMVTAVVDRLEAGEKIERPFVGISSIDITDTYQLYRYGLLFDKDYDHGIVVLQVENDSSAFIAGLQEKDIILKIDDYDIKDSAYFRYVLYKYSVGDTIKITYERDGESYIVDVILNNSL